MKITRKQAILILLCGPAARSQVNVAQTSNGEIIVDATKAVPLPQWKDTTGLTLSLADRSEELYTYPVIRGIDSLTINYNGETRTITAKEIWEALV